MSPTVINKRELNKVFKKILDICAINSLKIEESEACDMGKNIVKIRITYKMTVFLYPEDQNATISHVVYINKKYLKK